MVESQWKTRKKNQIIERMNQSSENHKPNMEISWTIQSDFFLLLLAAASLCSPFFILFFLRFSRLLVGTQQFGYPNHQIKALQLNIPQKDNIESEKLNICGFWRFVGIDRWYTIIGKPKLLDWTQLQMGRSGKMKQN